MKLHSPPPPYGFIKNLQLIHLRQSHVKFTGKNKVGNHVSKIMQLDWSKTAKQFPVNSHENLFVSISRAGKQTLGLEFSFPRFLDSLQLFRL